MRVWLVTVGEPLPTDGTGERLLRTGLLADTLAKRGHEVDFWTSTFDHTAKRSRAEQSITLSLAPNYRIRMLHGPSYERNISFARIRHHQQVAAGFAKGIAEMARSESGKPDIILSSMPLWELCDIATSFGKSHGIPTLVDIRDMWPDAIVDLAPRWIRPLVRAVAQPAYSAFRRSIRNATGITGMTEGAVQWALDSARKPACPVDRAFPFGYRRREPSEVDKQAGFEFWSHFSLTPESPEFTLCFFGAIGPHFDFETILAASKLIKQSGRRVRFVLCGTGDHLQKWRSLAENDPQIVLPGWVNAAKIWTLMSMSAAGLAPYHSSWDFQLSIPNKPIEYLSGGLPVISSLQGELQRLLAKHDCGLTYANGHPEQLAAAVSSLFDAPHRHRSMAANAKSLFLRQFVAEKVYSDFSDFMEELSKDHRASSGHDLQNIGMNRAA